MLKLKKTMILMSAILTGLLTFGIVNDVSAAEKSAKSDKVNTTRSKNLSKII